MHVALDVQNADGRLAPGSFATVTWPVERSYPTLFVPASTVATDQQRTFVIRVVGEQAEWVEVVRNATDSIRNGQKVRLSAAKGAQGGGAKR